jgi:D-alanyl-D-alanine carboxypeptidase
MKRVRNDKARKYLPMKKLYYLAFSVLILLGSCAKSDEPDVTSSQTGTELKQAVERIYNSYMQQYPQYPGSLVLKVNSKKGSWFFVAGDQSLSSQSHFRCASNSKSFTAAAIILLSQEGKLNINDTITGIIPGTQETYIPLYLDNYKIPYYNQMTIRQLLQHRAGVFDVTNQNIPDTVQEVPYHGQNYLEYVMKTEPHHTFTFDELAGVVQTCRLSLFKPGTSYHYSNTGYTILGKIIERVSGMSYQQFITEKIINNIGLPNTSCPILGNDVTLPVPFAKGYIMDSTGVKECTESNISGNVAEGNIITTPDDLAKYLRTLLRGEGPLLPYYVNNQLLLPIDGSQVNWYACGLNYANNLGFGHNGAHEGYLSRMVYDPVTDFTVVAFTNSWNAMNGLHTIGYQLNNMLDEVCYEAKSIVNK